MATAIVVPHSERITDLSHHVDSCAAIVHAIAHHLCDEEQSEGKQLYAVAELLRRLSGDLDDEAQALEKEELA